MRVICISDPQIHVSSLCTNCVKTDFSKMGGAQLPLTSWERLHMEGKIETACLKMSIFCSYI